MMHFRDCLCYISVTAYAAEKEWSEVNAIDPQGTAIDPQGTAIDPQGTADLLAIASEDAKAAEAAEEANAVAQAREEPEQVAAVAGSIDRTQWLDAKAAWRIAEEAKAASEAKAAQEAKAAEEAKAAKEAKAASEAKGAEKAKGAEEAQAPEQAKHVIPVLGCMIVNRPDLMLVMLKNIDHPAQQLVIVHNLDSHSATNNEVDRILGLLLEDPVKLLGHNHVKSVLTFHHTANLGFRCGCCRTCGSVVCLLLVSLLVSVLSICVLPQRWNKSNCVGFAECCILVDGEQRHWV